MSDSETVQLDWIPDLDPLSDDIFVEYDAVNQATVDMNPSTNNASQEIQENPSLPSNDNQNNHIEVEKTEKRKTISFDDAEKRKNKRSRSSSRDNGEDTNPRESRPSYREPRKRSQSREYGPKRSHSRKRSKEHQRSSHSRQEHSRSQSAIKPNKNGPSTSNSQNNSEKIDWETLAVQKINFKEEDHFAIVDFFVDPLMILKGTSNEGFIHFDDFPNGSINDLANAVLDRIDQAKNSTKRTYITAAIFGRNFERLGRDGVTTVARKIAEEIPLDKRGYSKIRLTFSTITYFPAMQHRWPEIQETNFFLKQLTHALGSTPMNGHRWTMNPNKFHIKRREINGHCFEEFVRKTGLGRSLSKFGTEKLAKAIIMHHTSGVREVTGQNYHMEPTPVQLNITTGYKLPPIECRDRALVQEKRWLFKIMGDIEGKTQLAKNTPRQSEQEFKSQVQQIISAIVDKILLIQDYKTSKEEKTMDVVEPVDMDVVESVDEKDYTAQLKEVINEQDNKIAELESQASSAASYRHEFEQLLKEEHKKIAEMSNKHRTEISLIKRQLEEAKLHKGMDGQDQTDARAQQKIERLENKVKKLVKDLRDEQDENAEDMQEAKEEIQTLKNKVQDLERDLKIQREINVALKEKRERK